MTEFTVLNPATEEPVTTVTQASAYLCYKHVIPYMRRQGKGAIINTASFVAVLGAATSQISYTASKGGVLAMSRELGVQFAREGNLRRPRDAPLKVQGAVRVRSWMVTGMARSSASTSSLYSGPMSVST
jgi:NAD(P)-dependent dehydrogenase (short-subunit alcohol dehydrogenase family)